MGLSLVVVFYPAYQVQARTARATSVENVTANTARRRTWARHTKICKGRERRSKCKVCTREFNFYAAVRQHERQAHPAFYEESKKRVLYGKRSEPELYEIIAR